MIILEKNCSKIFCERDKVENYYVKTYKKRKKENYKTDRDEGVAVLGKDVEG